MKVNDYVRTKDGIEKITDIKEWVNFQGYEKIITTDKNQYETLYEQSEIIKSSSNIIDLIEDEDYVNGYRVLNVIDFNDDSKMLSLEKIYDSKITNEDIKSIVTKEQFKSMEYEVE